MQAIQNIRLILSLLPVIIEALKAIENVLPQGGNGAQKLELVRQTLEAGYNISNDAVTSFETLWPAIEKVISATVTVFNNTGVFKKS